MKNCPKCGETHEKTGVFCSRSCANSRVRTPEVKLKISNTLKGVKHPRERVEKTQEALRNRSEEEKQKSRVKTSESLKKVWDEKGRIPLEVKKTRNVAGVQRYRAKRKGLTPEDADQKLITLIYSKCPKGYEVDHIVPLSKGGFHHQDNLQYLPGLENKRKGNRNSYNESLAVRWQDLI